MKTRLLFFSLLFSFYFASAQDNIILYGLEQNFGDPTPSNPFGEVESMDLVSINPTTGDKTTLFGIVDAESVAAGSSTFSAGANKYFFWGYDDVFAQRIYSLDIDQGTTIDNPVTPNNHVEMEYNYSNEKVYSFEFDGSENNLVELDLTTGVSTIVSDLADIEATAIGNSTFDPINNLYIGFGVAGNEYRIFGVDVLTGEMVYNSTLDDDDGLILAFEYDWTNERLLGLRQVSMPDPNNPFEFLIDNYMVEVDLATGQATDLFTEPVFSGAGVAVGGVGFDQQSQTYITYVGGNYDLGMINTNTGELFNVVTLGKPFYELQVDNFDYAQSLSVAAPTAIKNNTVTETISVSPNPVDDKLRIDLGEKFEPGNTLEIFDVNGKQLTVQNINFNLIETSVSNLEAGVYFIRIRQTDKILNAKFTKF